MIKTLDRFIKCALDQTGVRSWWIYQNIVRPIHQRHVLRQWWRKGRQVPPPHQIKVNTILFWGDYIGAEIIVETGTFKGDLVRAVHERFRRTITIELAPKLAALVRSEFQHAAGVEVITGDSGIELKKILPTLDAPTIFWLDAHYCGPRTAGENVVPILAEINSISSIIKWPHVIIIDDMRLFTGLEGYPTQVELQQQLKTVLGYDTRISNDMLQAVMT